MIRYHMHHIKPRHAGGTDDPSNLKRVTVEEHAEEHLKLYKQHGRMEDLIAYRALSGQITMNEASIKAWKLGSQKGGQSNAKNKTGFCKLSHKEHVEAGKKAAAAVISRGVCFGGSEGQRRNSFKGNLSIAKRRAEDPEWWTQVCEKISEANKGSIPPNKAFVHCIHCRQECPPSRLLRNHRSCFKTYASRLT